MKKFFLSTALFLSAIVCALSFASCGGDDEGNEGGFGGGVNTPTNTVDEYKVGYKITLEDTWYQFFDIVITYKYNNTIGEKTETLTKNKDYNLICPYTAKPDHFVCKIVAKPKANHPEIEDGKEYSMKVNCYITVDAYDNDGNYLDDYSAITFRRIDNVALKSAKEMREALTKEYVIVDHESFPKEP